MPSFSPPSLDLLPGIVASIPSPSSGVWELGPIPIRGYALCIILGIIAAIWIGERRWIARGGKAGEVQDLALLAIPFGIVGARLYHVATDWEQYFGADGSPVQALYIWRGGLGIWGGVILGAFGIWVGCRLKGIRFGSMIDALAPGVLIAQAIGRWGNWFNQELYGGPTDLPWGLEIDRAHFSSSYVESLGGQPVPEMATFHPTFLYEGLWNVAMFVLVIWLERRFRLGYGRVLAAYVMAYSAGRVWVEALRIDDVQLNDVYGLRWNVWFAIALFVAAAIFMAWSVRRHPGQPAEVYLTAPAPASDASDTSGAEGASESEAVDEAEGADVTDDTSESTGD